MYHNSNNNKIRTIKIVTYNCNGIKDNAKRSRIFYQFKIDNNCDVVFLQETHLSNVAERRAWETQWPGKSLWSYGSPHSRGVGILFNSKLDFQLTFFHHDNDGRLLVADIVVNKVKWRLINVYCPNRPASRDSFLESIAPWLNTSRALLVGGDFNFVDNLTLDKVGGNPLEGKDGSDTWKRVRQCGDLSDPFRRFFKNKIVTTWQSADKTIACRLDRFYVCGRSQAAVVDVTVKASCDSDHSAVCIAIKASNNNNIGPGYWKCNFRTLDDPHFRTDIEALWHDLSTIPNKNLTWWEDCKTAFKKLIINHSCRLSRNRNAELRELNAMLCDLSSHRPPTEDVIILIDELKKRINDLLDVKVEGAKVRSKIQFLDNEEKPTRFFLQKEKTRATKAHITELNVSGNTITDTSQIVAECKNFYSNLYSEEQIDPSSADHFMDGLPRLQPESAAVCEGPLTVAECLKAIGQMKPFKTPGSDGLPKEFYSRFFYLFGDYFVNIMNSACEDGLMSPTQRLSYITLLCKDNSNADSLSNWRPISLLNVDYKIVSKCLTNRLRRVLSEIIDCDQTCSIPGRSITDNLHLIRNAFDHCTNRNVSSIFISFDQAKAFDRVSHEYLFRVLTAFGFGASLIKWIALLYNDIYSQVLVNGYLSEAFRLSRSMRQGCGLSALLYVLCIEPLAHKIRTAPDIRGLHLPGSPSELRVSLYADDTTAVLMDTHSVRSVLDVFNRFCSASGSALNRSKCAALVVGRPMNTTDLPSWLQIKDTIKICGVYFGNDMVNINQAYLLSKILASLRVHKARALTLRGKVTVLNLLVCAKLWYVGTCVLFTSAFIDRVERALFDFLTNSRWIKRLTLILPPLEGGLGIFHLRSRFAALRCSHVKRLIMDGPPTKWKHFATFWVGLSLRKWAPNLASNLLPHSDWQPEFYQAALNEFRIFNAGNSVDPRSLTVKSLYNYFIKQAAITPRCIAAEPAINFTTTWRVLNNCDIDPRARDVMWRLAHGVLPVRYFLNHIHVTNCVLCPLCRVNNSWETTTHLFLHCPIARPIWVFLLPCLTRIAGKVLQINDVNVFFLNFDANLEQSNAAILARLFSEVIYCIWTKRNAVVFDRVKCVPQDIKLLFLYRLRVRLKADLLRLGEHLFNVCWKGVAFSLNGEFRISL